MRLKKFDGLGNVFGGPAKGNWLDVFGLLNFIAKFRNVFHRQPGISAAMSAMMLVY